MGYRRLIEPRIETGNSLPFKQKARAVSYARRILSRELCRVQRLGIISHANPREWPDASPRVIVAKNDDMLAMCVDYGQLKQMTI